MLNTSFDVPGPGCVYWSIRTTNMPAVRCMALELKWVKTPRGQCLMCHTHRNDYAKTGKIRTRRMADQFYSTSQYRPGPKVSSKRNPTRK